MYKSPLSIRYKRIFDSFKSTNTYSFYSTSSQSSLTNEFRNRLNALKNSLPTNTLAVFPSYPTRHMSKDIPYLYYPQTDLFYLTGITSPNSVLTLFKASDAACFSVLFSPPRNYEQELWDGERLSFDDIQQQCGVDQVLSIDSKSAFEQQFQNLILSANSIIFDPRIDSNFTSRLVSTANHYNLVDKLQSSMISQFDDRSRIVDRMRMIKSSFERQKLIQSAKIMSESINETIQWCGSNAVNQYPLYERTIASKLQFESSRRGSNCMAFPSVVASGKRACTLHAIDGSSLVNPSDLVFIDTGCQVDGYCSDISRAFPASGKFTPAQRDVYQLVLEIHLKLLSKLQEWNRNMIHNSNESVHSSSDYHLDELHRYSVRLIVEGLKDLNVFSNEESVDSLMNSGQYRKYYPHAVGHYLGLDVHDTHLMSKSIPFCDGMAITVEPGIYIRSDDEYASKELRGIGLRIEDDILFDENQVRNISESAARTPDEIEALMN